MKDVTKTPRLFIEDSLILGKGIVLTKEQSHYIGTVLRLRVGDFLRVFNGKDGEFLAQLTRVGKFCSIAIESLLKSQTFSKGLWLFFSPIKKDRMNFLIEKAVELGVQKLIPIITDRTIIRNLNIEKIRLNIIEASEQSERLDVPEIVPPILLKDISKVLNGSQHLYFCKERSKSDSLDSLALSPADGILVGPEGGFSKAEVSLLESISQTHPVSLGERILRAETAALYALSQWKETF